MWWEVLGLGLLCLVALALFRPKNEKTPERKPLTPKTARNSCSWYPFMIPRCWPPRGGPVAHLGSGDSEKIKRSGARLRVGGVFYHGSGGPGSGETDPRRGDPGLDRGQEIPLAPHERPGFPNERVCFAATGGFEGAAVPGLIETLIEALGVPERWPRPGWRKLSSPKAGKV